MAVKCSRCCNCDDGWCCYYKTSTSSLPSSCYDSDYRCPGFEDEYSGDTGSSDGCFMTSACVGYKGLDDNCAELEAMRSFRDNYLNKTEEGRNLAREYYKLAPQVVRYIDRSPLKDYYYNDIYLTVCKCKELIEEGKNNEAIDVYNEMFHKYLKISEKVN